LNLILFWGEQNTR